MRRMILTSLVLLPVMAQAAANASTEPQPSGSSAQVQTKLSRQVELALAAAAPTVTVPVNTTNHAAIREFVRTQMTENFTDAALLKGGTLEYAMTSSAPAQSSAPSVTKSVGLDLTSQEMSDQPATSSVVLHAVVDENGVPRNVSVARSAGSVIDRKAVAAVSEYRFKPATLDNKPTWASVSITIKIQKQQ